MTNLSHALTHFEYSALAVGSDTVADELSGLLGADSVQEHVQRAVHLERVPGPARGGLSAATEGFLDPRYQLVFIDATDPATVADRIACVARFTERCPSSEVVVLIGKRTEGDLVKLLHAGAWYFLEVPIDAQKLASILVRAVSFREASTLIRTDGLTGLYNRAFFEDALRDQIARLQHSIGGQRAQATPPVSLLVADLDNLFEAFGDRHDLRETFLREVGRVFRKGFRLDDIVARIGGDEFGALLVGLNYTLALMRGEIVRKSVAAIPRLDGASGHPTISVGVVTYPSFVDEPRQLYWQGRRALGRAKADGGNVVYGFDGNGNPTPFAELGA